MKTIQQTQSSWAKTWKVWLQYVAIGIGACWSVVVYALFSNFDFQVSFALVVALLSCPVAAFLAWKALSQNRYMWAIFAPLEIFSLLSALCSRVTTRNCLEPHRRI